MRCCFPRVLQHSRVVAFRYAKASGMKQKSSGGSNGPLGSRALFQRVRSGASLNDLALSAPQRDTLRSIVQRVEARVPVAASGLPGSAAHRSVMALFVSPDSAAGRTAASVLANELGVGLYRIDLSAVVGKFIGETEKNLSAVFADAEAAGAILFIDEADALFGKRSEVKDAHDRFANIEVNYLLQRLEDFNGLVVLASNSRDNVDPAIVRRVDYVLELPMPGKPPKSHSAAR
jgi:hypothetical protein